LGVTLRLEGAIEDATLQFAGLLARSLGLVEALDAVEQCVQSGRNYPGHD